MTHRLMTHRYLKFVCLGFVLVLASPHVNAIDLQPGDVIAPKPDISAAQLTYQYSEKMSFIVMGISRQVGPRIIPVFML